MSRVEGQNNGITANNMKERQGGNTPLKKVIDDGAGDNPFTWTDRLLRSKSAKTGLSAAAAAIFAGLVPGAAASNTAIVEQGEMPSQTGGVLEQLENALANQETDGWPIMEGLNYKDGTYYYQKDNVYGGKEGEVAGLVKPEVYVEGEKIGGVCFKPEVCKVMLENAYAKIPEKEPNLIDILPLNISNYDGSIKIDSGSLFNDYSKEYVYGVKIECYDDVAILNTHLGASWWGSGEITINKGDSARLFQDGLVIPIDIKEHPVFAFSHAYVFSKLYILSGGDLCESKEINSEDVLFGEKIGYKGVNDVVYITGVFPEVMEKFGNPKIEDFLTVEDKIVFMIPYETITELDDSRVLQARTFDSDEVIPKETIKGPGVEESEYKTLSVGYKGEEVVAFKERMVELGYFKNISSVNDTFTASTAEYFKEFQKINGLPVTGVADSETLKLFYSDKAKPKP